MKILNSSLLVFIFILGVVSAPYPAYGKNPLTAWLSTFKIVCVCNCWSLNRGQLCPIERDRNGSCDDFHFVQEEDSNSEYCQDNNAGHYCVGFDDDNRKQEGLLENCGRTGKYVLD